MLSCQFRLLNCIGFLVFGGTFVLLLLPPQLPYVLVPQPLAIPARSFQSGQDSLEPQSSAMLPLTSKMWQSRIVLRHISW